MLIYHPSYGLKEVATPPLPAAKVGTYIQSSTWNFTDRWKLRRWKLRIKRRTKGSTWKYVQVDDLPKELRLEALLLGLTL